MTKNNITNLLLTFILYLEDNQESQKVEDNKAEDPNAQKEDAAKEANPTDNKEGEQNEKVSFKYLVMIVLFNLLVYYTNNC